MSENISQLQIHPEDLQFRVEAKDWEDALKVAAAPLVKRDAITAVYIDEMIAAIHELGPYIVLAPGLALGHSRPSDAVHQTAISIATLAQPIEFGSKHNDPVDIVVILAAKDDESHIGLLQKIVIFFNSETNFDLLRSARTEEDALNVSKVINGEA